jgi:hypothetical protein
MRALLSPMKSAMALGAIMGRLNAAASENSDG